MNQGGFLFCTPALGFLQWNTSVYQHLNEFRRMNQSRFLFAHLPAMEYISVRISLFFGRM